MSFIRPDIIRPPSEARAYFLPLTSGCSNNSCIFCNFYGLKLGIRPREEVKREIDALALFKKSRIRIPEIPDIVYYIGSEWDCRRIFLQDGDAMVYPYPELKEILEYLNAKFPDLERIASYGTPQDLKRYNVAELQELKRLKLGIIYMGVESGDDDILEFIGKGVDSDYIVASGRKVKEAGITLSVTVILGLGGVEHSQRHALATADILTRLDPQFAGALTLTLIPQTPLYDLFQTGHFSLITPFESLQELKTVVEKSNFTNCFFSSMHASNYLSVRGFLPLEKKNMLAQINYVLSCNDPSLLRPEFMRGL